MRFPPIFINPGSYHQWESEVSRMTVTTVATASRTQLTAVRRALQSYSDNPSAFLALNSGNSYFSAPGLDGVVVYRPCGRHLVQFGGPFAPDADYAELLERFDLFARGIHKRVVAIQLQASDAQRYA